MSLHVCVSPVWAYRATLLCETCGCNRRFLIELHAWWGTTKTCLTCGDTWDFEYGRLRRPFKSGWRKEAVARAKAQPYTTKREAYRAEWRYISGED